MFDLKQIAVIKAALVVQSKSVMRLAAKEGQPESVAQEYRKVGQEIAEVFKVVEAEQVKLEQLAKAGKK